jgi:hypothetical protein
MKIMLVDHECSRFKSCCSPWVWNQTDNLSINMSKGWFELAYSPCAPPQIILERRAMDAEAALYA